MKKPILFAAIAMLLYCGNSLAQTEPQNNASKPIEKSQTDQYPEFPGGFNAYTKFLQSTLVYPAMARKDNIQGKVFINFIVETDGSLTDIKVIKGVGGGCNEEAVRVIKSSPKWKPGIAKGKAVRVNYTLPIAFKLNNSESDTIIDFTKAEKTPEFPGGNVAFSKFLQTNLKYPAAARTNQIQGKVFVQFVVEKDGSVTDVKVIRGIGAGCDEEAVRVIKASPKWHPGMQKGKPVKTKYTMPIAFKL